MTPPTAAFRLAGSGVRFVHVSVAGSYASTVSRWLLDPKPLSPPSTRMRFSTTNADATVCETGRGRLAAVTHESLEGS